MDNYAPLHNHGVMSILDGISQPTRLVDRATELGMTSIALTDHGNIHGWLDFYDACHAKGVNPILGMEAYQARKSRFDRDPEELAGSAIAGMEQRGPYHLVLLARNLTGYRNIIKLSSRAYLEGFYRHPRLDYELLAEHAEGVTILTACLNGAMNQALLRDDYAAALTAAGKLQDIAGKENLYIEIHDHGIPEQDQVKPGTLSIAKKLGALIVPTGDSHYVLRSDSHLHDCSLCISTNSLVAEEKRFRFKPEEFYLKSYQEMRTRFPSDWLANTLRVAESVELDLQFGELYFPEFDIPNGEDVDVYLEREIEVGLRFRYGDPLPAKVQERYHHELGVVKRMGFQHYFLVVADLVKWARDNGIRTGYGRGCLTGTAEVLANNRFIKISDVKKGDTVISHTGKECSVLNTFKYEVDEELVTIRSYHDNSVGITLTADHKVLIEKGKETDQYHKIGSKSRRFEPAVGNFVWTSAEDVRPGDWVYVPQPAYEEIDKKIFDLADYSEGMEIWPSRIVEKTLINSSYPFSVRETAVKYNIARTTLVRIFRDGLDGAQDRTKKIVVQILLDGGFSSLEDWRKHIDLNSVKSYYHPRFIPVDSVFCRFLGMFVSDGWLSQNKYEIGLATRGSTDDGLSLRIFSKVFGLKATLNIHKQKDLHQYTIQSKVIWRFLKNIFNEYNHTALTKHLPDWALDLSSQKLTNIRDGLWWGDGSFKDRTSYTSSSRRLIEQVRILLWRLNIPNGIRVDDRVDLRSEFNNRSRAYKIVTVKNFESTTKAISLQGGMALRVFKVSKQRVKTEVYDLEVENDNSFLTNSFVVHNSAAGSILSYALRITNLDPLRFGLLFERFLIEGRKSPPDIDLDFDDRYRDRVIDYARSKYGIDRVANIGTFSTIGSRMAIRDSARILGYGFKDGDRLAKLVPAPMLGKPPTLTDAMENPEFCKAYEKDADSKLIVDTAKGLEGLVRQTGVHAAGIIIARSDVIDYVPVMRKTDKQGKPGPIITQWDMGRVEQNGLLKIDFLGLRNLGVIDMCLANVKERSGEDIDLDILPLDDSLTYEKLREGQAIGTFQLEGSGMRRMMQNLQPSCIEDVMALVALFRPGPLGSHMDKAFIQRKHGRASVSYEHPSLEQSLVNTYGLMLYQEDVLSVARILAGFSVPEADDLRKAVGKKQMDKIGLFRHKFVAGCQKTHSLDEGLANKIYSDIEFFGGYGFPKAHAAGYGMISYVTAYLKFHYPAEYMAALLTSVKTKDAATPYLNECRRMGIAVLPPSITRSKADFVVTADDEILFGLRSVSGVGATVVDFLLSDQERKKHKNIYEFLRQVNPEVLDKGTLEHLVYSGALDELVPPVEEQSLSRVEKMELLDLEKKELGLYVSDHPLNDVWHILKPQVTCTLDELDLQADKQFITVGGLLSDVTKRITKAGHPMVIMTLEDLTGFVEILVFSKQTKQLPDDLKTGTIVLVEGRLGIEEEGGNKTFRIFFSKLRVVDTSAFSGGESISLTFPEPPSFGILDKMRRLIELSPGNNSVYIEFPEGPHNITMKFDKSTSISYQQLQIVTLQERVGL